MVSAVENCLIFTDCPLVHTLPTSSYFTFTFLHVTSQFLKFYQNLMIYNGGKYFVRI